jgi:Predicted transcriptional regulator
MFRSKVKETMKSKGTTIRDLVAETGLSSKTINKARQDEGISECRLSTLARIAQALGVSTKDLYEETSIPVCSIFNTQWSSLCG